MIMERGEAAQLMTAAAVAGKPFEQAGVPDTPRNRALYAKIVGEIQAMPKGQTPEIPFDYALM
jgi:hypothetical protein